MKVVSYDSEKILDHVRSLYDLGIKRPGSTDAVLAEEYLISTLAGYGYAVKPTRYRR